MRVVLVNLPWKSFRKTGVRAGSRWPHLRGRHEQTYLPFPFFLAYSASLLKKYNFEVTLIDAIAEGISYSHCLRYIRHTKADLLVCETSTVTLDHDLRLLERIGRDIPIVLCGPDVNIRKPAFLEKYKFITYVLVGEYEFTLLDLVQHLDNDKNLKDVLGLIYRDANKVKINPPRPLMDLNQLPWPLREGLPMERYNDAPGNMPLPSVQMIASRGCPYGCKFCLWPQVMYQGNNYRTRDVVDVINEMEYLVKEMGFKSIYFDDDTFNCGKERMLRLCNEIKRQKLNVPWAIMARPDLMSEEILENMKEAGLYAIKYGVESATQELLDNINKNMNLKNTENIIRFTKMLGIKTHLTFIFGLPGETKESIRRTIDFALRLDPTSIQFSIATPFPGTVFYNEMEQKGCILSKSWSEYDGNYKSVICSENLTKKDIEHAIRIAYKEWAGHCTKRKYLEGIISDMPYYRLFLNYLKKYGLFTTLFKTFRFTIRFLAMFFKEKLGYFREAVEKELKEKGLKVGRLALVFDANGAGLYWDGIKLTRGEGFVSCISINSEDKKVFQPSFIFSNLEKLDNNKLLLKRKYGSLPLEETWMIEIIDEKQIDWNVRIEAKEDIEIIEEKMAVILSGKYRKWVDAWGEGRFYPLHEYREVELRNPATKIIGVRGCRKLNGQLPTILLDISSNDNMLRSSVKNSPIVLGARILEIKMRTDKAKQAHSSCRSFTARIKIVEEGFK